MIGKALIALAAALALFASSVSGQQRNIVEIAVANDDFSTLVTTLAAAGLDETLSNAGTFTVFAPTDDAFLNVNVTMLLEEQWRAHLKSLLLYHVLGSEVFSSDLMHRRIKTLQGSSITISSLAPPQVDFAEIIIPDVDASNGVIHVIDDVLLPPSMMETIAELALSTLNLSTFADLVLKAGLDGILSGGGPFSVFAPSNDAFAPVDQATLNALAADPNGLLNFLRHHMMDGIVLAEELEVTEVSRSVPITLQGSTLDVSLDSISVMNVLASNGVIHVITKALVPLPSTVGGPAPVAVLLAPAAIPTQAPAPVPAPAPTSTFVSAVFSVTVYDLVAANDLFDTFVAALEIADLVDVLKGDGPFTVFAPVNGSFAAPPLEKLLEDQWRAHLTGLLLYHVVPGIIMSSDLQLNATSTTLEGSNVTVTSLDPPMINDAKVIRVDVEAFNGVIHTIDKVLLPPFITNSLVEIAKDIPALSTLVDLVAAAGLVDALSGEEGPFTIFAPTNEAFAKLPQDAKLPQTIVDKMLADSTGALTDILLYQVVPGIAQATDLTQGASLETLNGASLTVSLDPLRINNAQIVEADVLGSNGIIHLIDSVLLPPDLDIPETRPPTMVPSMKPSLEPTLAPNYQRLKAANLLGDGTGACIEVKGGVAVNGQRVILGDCTAAKGGWEIDDNSMIHSELNDSFCLQAGGNMLGRTLRIQQCDIQNQLQRWNFESGKELRPALDDGLCVVWRGVNPNIGVDPMVLQGCDRIETEGKKNWILHDSYNVPVD